MSDPLDDIMKQVAKGDKIAFRALAREIGPRLFAVAYRLVGQDKMMAEDAMQETLIKLWTGAPRYIPRGTFIAYAMTVLHHCCMDLYRRRSASPYTQLEEDLPDKETSILTKLEDRAESETIATHIQALPTRQRQAVLLSYYAEEPHARIAQMLQTSEKAVESLLSRARRTLARDLPPDFHPTRHSFMEGDPS